MRCNNLVDQKMVMAHVYGHSDFFKCNYWFSATNRKMMDEIANHGVRIRRYFERFGQDVVESFLDSCLSLDNLIDIHSPFIKRRESKVNQDRQSSPHTVHAPRMKSKSYMDNFINPPDYLEAERDRMIEELEKQKNFPEEPQKDVLLFLIEHAHLERWQRDVLSIVREEAYYFAPQGMTKIMNEGWASYWHSTIMTQKAATGEEIVDFADHHSRTMATQPGQLNPYKVGLELFRDIEDRWNCGRYGAEWENCDDYSRKASWNTHEDNGREKIFEVRRIYNDVTFIDEFLTEEFCREHKLFTYAFNKQTQEFVIDDREFRAIKEKLLFGLTNMGQPSIYVENGNYKNRGELFLRHDFAGMPLKHSDARDTLANVFNVWGRPVHIETRVDKRKKILSYDGKKHDEKIIK
jgi:stage V sporulation protein R